MKHIKTFALLLLITITVSACSPEKKQVRDSLFVLGTIVNITLMVADEQKAAKAIKDIDTDLKYLHTVWHPWRFGAMSRTNQLLKLNEWFSANPSVLPVMEKSKQLYKTSQGLFNPAIGELIGIWSFHNDEVLDGPIPEASVIKAFIDDLPTMDHVEVDGFRLRGTHPRVQLDVGAIAKGMAVERVITYLKQVGINDAIVNAGGDLKAIGSHGERAWSVGIRHPRQDGIMAGLAVNDNESVFTSGDYERYFENQGQRYHHILDPRTGYPADKTQSVTVIHPDAGLADAAATALFIAGPEQWQAIAQSMGIDKVLLIDQQGRAHMTRAMAKRLTFEIEPPAKIIVD
ncbi:MAG: FAD:protein FMN transferase [Thioalkalispiraceae bacterium]|jgi:thiamine biosynthesis lipoprotein